MITYDEAAESATRQRKYGTLKAQTRTQTGDLSVIIIWQLRVVPRATRARGHVVAALRGRSVFGHSIILCIFCKITELRSHFVFPPPRPLSNVNLRVAVATEAPKL